MKPIAMSSDLRKLIYGQYCPVIAKILAISTPFTFIELDPGSNSVAYTVLDGSRKTHIFINPYHPMFSADPDPARQACAFTGVLIHEMLHKKYTEPVYCQSLARKEQIQNINLFLAISNIIEDFTIESRAIVDLDLSDATLRMIENATGISFANKKPLAALDTAIITSWTQSRPVDPTDPVCGQVLDALIDFTDLGPLVPGSMLSTEAANLYRTIAPMIYEAIWKSPFERAQTTLEVYRAMEPYLDGKDHLLVDKAEGGTSGPNGEACQEAADRETREAVEGSDAMKAKIRIVKQLMEQNREEQPEQTSPGNLMRGTAPENAPAVNASAAGDAKEPSACQSDHTSDEKSGDSRACERNDAGSSESSAKNGSSSGDENTDSEDPESGYENDTEEENTTDGSSDNEAPDSESSPESPGRDGSAENVPHGESQESPELPPDAFATDPETERRIRNLQSEISSETFDVSDLQPGSISREADFSKHDSQVIDYSLDESVESGYFDGKTVKCLNFRVDGISRSTYEQYEGIKRRNAAEIARFSRRMRRLVSDNETASFEKNGRLNMKRYAEKGTSTINLFSRRTQKDRQNSRVLICLDVSGSMHGNKIAKAGEALVCLVEGLTSAGIPVKVITFCENQDTVTHHHYVNYGNSRLDRVSLMLIEPGGRNFDGFSIRYAVKDLMKKRVNHDILIIISDGQPNTSYIDYKHMLADTAAAVTEAKRLTRVIGIGIDANIDTLKGFYKDTFVEMTDIENLMKNLTRLIEKEVRSW